MTREEAIKILEQKFELSCRNNLFQNAEKLDYEDALWVAITALCPISREQVEKVWSGCDYCTGDVDDRPYLYSQRYYIDEFGILTDGIENISVSELNFCPICGKPLINEAVDMVMERLEALKDDTP